MKKSVGVVAVAIVTMLSPALTPSVTRAAIQAFLVPGTGEPNSNILEGYNENARTYYMTPFTGCTDDNGCNVQGINYPAQFWPIPIRNWGGISAPSWNESVGTGVEALNNTLSQWSQVDQTGDVVVVFGYSQGARVVSLSKEYFASNIPDPAFRDRLEFVVIGNISRPNGGLWARLSAFGYVPIWDVTYGHATPTDLGPDCTDGVNQCTTTDIVLQYDGVGDFPNYLFNVLSVVNAFLGVETVHPSYLVPNEESTPEHRPDGWLPGQGYTPEQLNELLNDPANQQRFGDTLYITVPTQILPIVQPLLLLGQEVPFLSPVIDPLVELISPVLRWEIDNGYDRSINPGVPTGIKLFRIPFVDYDPIQEVGEFFDAVQQGFSDAFDGVAPPWYPVAPATTSALAVADTDLAQSSAPAPAAKARPAPESGDSAATHPGDAVTDEVTADADAGRTTAGATAEETDDTTAVRSGNKVSPDLDKVSDDSSRSTIDGEDPTPRSSTTSDSATSDAAPTGADTKTTDAEATAAAGATTSGGGAPGAAQ